MDKQYFKEYYIKNKDKKTEQNKLWRNNNKEWIDNYNKTEKRIKIRRISLWKNRGILCFDFDLLYDIFLSTTNCENCNCILDTNTKTKKCLDHDHRITDKFNVREILCKSCNSKRQ